MAQTVKPEMSFLQHLEELRWVIIRSLVAIVIGATVAFCLRHVVFDIILLAPRTPEFPTNRLLCHLAGVFHQSTLCINQQPFQLISITMAGQLNTHVFVSLIAGLIVAFPYVFYQFWGFVAPALHENERMHARGAIFSCSVLFLIGILFGYYIILPFSVHFLGTYQVSSQVINQINITSYISNVSSVVLASGLVFELPVVVYFLARIGILTASFMRKYRRHAIIVILIIGAIITPPDVLSQILVSIPLYALYEASIFIAARIEKKRK
jgi:sec-independent protein translocase protein TatC